jgi:hypothetical protein
MGGPASRVRVAAWLDLAELAAVQHLVLLRGPGFIRPHLLEGALAATNAALAPVQGLMVPAGEVTLPAGEVTLPDGDGRPPEPKPEGEGAPAPIDGRARIELLTLAGAADAAVRQLEADGDLLCFVKSGFPV